MTTREDREFDELMGDASDDARLYSGLIAELAKGGAAIAADVKKQKEAEKKKEDLASVQKKAQDAADAARDAASEKDPSGPLHERAKSLAFFAQTAQRAYAERYPEDSLKSFSSFQPSGGMGAPSFFSRIPTWGWVVGGGLVLTGMVLLLRRRS